MHIFCAAEMVKTRLFPAAGQTSATEQEQQDFTALGMHFSAQPAAFMCAWRNTRRIPEQLDGAERASGAELASFTVTAEHEMDPDALCQESVPAYQRLREISDDLGVTYIDLQPEFRPRALAGERVAEALRARIPASE
jgi:hypothetical protein